MFVKGLVKYVCDSCQRFVKEGGKSIFDPYQRYVKGVPRDSDARQSCIKCVSKVLSNMFSSASSVGSFAGFKLTQSNFFFSFLVLS